MYVLMLVAAGGSVLLNDALGANSLAVDLLNTSWILAPYLVLTAVMAIGEKRTLLLSTAVATLLGAVGALTSVVMMTLFEDGIDARLVPIYQAGAIAVLLPTCKWLIARFDVMPPAKS
jgi:hypothetical protein